MNTKLETAVSGLVLLLSAAVITVVIYVAVFGVFNDSYLRVGMLLVGGILILLGQIQYSSTIFSRFLLALTGAALFAAVWQYFKAAAEIETGLYFLTSNDILFGLLGLAAVIEMTRRSVGMVMASVAGIVLIYGMFGDHAPSFLRHAGISTEEIVQVLWFSFDGVFGAPRLQRLCPQF